MAKRCEGYGYEMPHGSYSLGEVPDEFNMIRLTCPNVAGQYRVDKLLERYGPDIAMPDLRHELPQCPHRRSMNDPRQVRYGSVSGPFVIELSLGLCGDGGCLSSAA
jgi:hypothetical protein